MQPTSHRKVHLMKKGLLVQTGNRLKYIDSKGKEHIDFRKQWTGDKLDMIMAEFKDEEPVEEMEDIDAPIEVETETKTKTKSKKEE
jgi:hypothetical protein